MGIRAAGYPHRLVAAWRSGSPRSQRHVALIMLSIIVASLVVSVVAPEGMPLAAYLVWLLIAMMLLRFRPLVLVGAADAAAGVLALAITGPITGSRAIEMAALVMAVLLVLVVASRQRSGLPALLSEAFGSRYDDALSRLRTNAPGGFDAQCSVVLIVFGVFVVQVRLHHEAPASQPGVAAQVAGAKPCIHAPRVHRGLAPQLVS